MGDILTQEEVDALLSGLTGGRIAAETDIPAGSESYVPFDFMNQGRIVRGRLPMLEMLHERFGRLFRQTLSATMQRVVDVNMLALDLNKFGEFMRGLSSPSSLNIFRLDPLPGFGLLALEGNLVFAMINSFFGGKATRAYPMEKPDFSPIEQKLIKTVVDLILRDYSLVWQPVHPIRVGHVRTEVNPQFVSIVPDSDGVVVAEIEFSIEESTERMFFCIPYATLEPIKEKLKQSYQGESPENVNAWQDLMTAHLSNVEVDMAVRLGTAEITGRQILDLKVGDIIQLNERCSQPVNVYVADILKMKGQVGSAYGNKAIRVTQLIPPGKA